ncbi:MAG: phosphoserine phosphatase SerB [Actinobacteria bacterium]|uniref:phosphoserine phosphatase n=1 Tax=freshwater metagenome TaxID=449393 RepID=A0A6J7CIG9_9ZZZZ|nr:phosphoserine phosphatase SerB [Actinomycetota bacterium]
MESDDEEFTGLILLSGLDKPGITQELFAVLAPFSITILDIEQVIISGRLILTILIGLNPNHEKAIEADLMDCAGQLDVDIATLFTRTAHSSIAIKQGLLHVVILSTKLKPAAVADLAGAITACGANIERVSRTASTPVTAIEFILSGSSQDIVSSALSPVAATHGVDISVSKGGLLRFAKKLVQLDVDSTLITQEVIELLAEKAGVGEQVKTITEAAMRGELDFEQSLRARVLLLKGLPESTLAEVADEIVLTPGAKTLIKTLHKLGHTVSIVSGGFSDVIAPMITTLGITHFRANKLSISQGFLTGELEGPVIDRAAKAQALRDFAELESVTMEQTVAIGDGANDLDMIAAAGLGIAFNAKPAVRAAADTSLTAPYLDSVLYLLGIPREAIEEG